jgi:triphosphoribosyl-dephospho-CoA synthase
VATPLLALSPEEVVAAARVACAAEIAAFKPGNVSIHSPGHGMVAEDFRASAEVACPWLGRREIPLGERILGAARATRERVGCNTNLGILLLLAPLAEAALRPALAGGLALRLAPVLAGLTAADAAAVFAAIRVASPGGLGESATDDVRGAPSGTLLDAMRQAEGRDRIAYQYAHGFADVFALGVATLRRWDLAPGSIQGSAPRSAPRSEWATVRCYLRFLATLPDSHVARKFGAARAETLRQQAARLEADVDGALGWDLEGAGTGDDGGSLPFLRQFDRLLKEERVNPGTSADLTAASLFARDLDDLLVLRGAE